MTDLDKKVKAAVRVYRAPKMNMPAASSPGGGGWTVDANFKFIKILRDELTGELISWVVIPADINQVDGAVDPIMPTRLYAPSGSQTVNNFFASPQSDGNGNAISGYVFIDYQMGFNGTSWDRIRIANKLVTPAAAISPITLNAAGGAGTFFRVFRIIASLTAAGNLTVSDGTFNWLNAQPLPTVNLPFSFDFGPQGIVGTGAAAALTATFTGGGNADLAVLYAGPSVTA